MVAVSSLTLVAMLCNRQLLILPSHYVGRNSSRKKRSLDGSPGLGNHHVTISATKPKKITITGPMISNINIHLLTGRMYGPA